MEQSILKSTKEMLGVSQDDTVFDLSIITHINSAFFTLNQLGVGSPTGFSIDDDTADWETFLPESSLLNSVKTFVFLKVRMLFDPPQTSYLITAFEKQLEQIEWRISTAREETGWSDPDPPVPVEEDEVII